MRLFFHGTGIKQERNGKNRQGRGISPARFVRGTNDRDGKETDMRSDDIKILQGIQKNTDMAMKAIESLSGKIYDDALAIQISRQGMKYAEIHNKATGRLLDEGAQGYQGSNVQDLMLKGAIMGNTLLDTSTGHIAEMMIQGSNRGLTDMWKTINHNENAGNASLEIAKELMDFEEKNIERLKKYL